MIAIAAEKRKRLANVTSCRSTFAWRVASDLRVNTISVGQFIKPFAKWRGGSSVKERLDYWLNQLDRLLKVAVKGGLVQVLL